MLTCNQKTLPVDKITWLNELGVDTFWLRDSSDNKNSTVASVSEKSGSNLQRLSKSANQGATISSQDFKSADQKSTANLAAMPGPLSAGAGGVDKTVGQDDKTVGQDDEAVDQVDATVDQGSRPESVKISQADIVACTSLEQLNALYKKSAQYNPGVQATSANLVYGEGVTANPVYMIIGEQPSSDDEALSRPFQGAQGELLQAICKAVALPHQDSCYKTHFIKYRLSTGQPSDTDLVASLLPLIQQEIGLVKPKNIIALGSVVAGALLGAGNDLKALHGRMNYYQDDSSGTKIPLWISHQPVALLVHGARKDQAWRDFVAIAEFNS